MHKYWQLVSVAICGIIDELCIQNDEFCIQNDGFCIENDDFNANVKGPDGSNHEYLDYSVHLLRGRLVQNEFPIFHVIMV